MQQVSTRTTATAAKPAAAEPDSEPATPVTQSSAEAVIGGVIGALSAARTAKNEAAVEERRWLKMLDQLAEAGLTVGVYDGWDLAEGKTAMILDQDAVKADFEARGQQVPMKETRPGWSIGRAENAPQQ
jgi:hypothetical protein